MHTKDKNAVEIKTNTEGNAKPCAMQISPPPSYTPIEITDEEWIAASQACCGIDFTKRLKKNDSDT